MLVQHKSNTSSAVLQAASSSQYLVMRWLKRRRYVRASSNRMTAEDLLEALRSYKEYILTLSPGSFYPGSMVDVILNDGEIRTQPAIWWYLIDEKTGKPNYKYTTFNARNLENRTWKAPIKTSRCIVLATAFAESIGEGKDKRSYLLESESAFIVGGLYKVNGTPHGPLTSFAVITCNPHPRLSKYHDKACPLFLPADQGHHRHLIEPEHPRRPLTHDLIDHPAIPTVSG